MILRQTSLGQQTGWKDIGQVQDWAKSMGYRTEWDGKSVLTVYTERDVQKYWERNNGEIYDPFPTDD